MAKVHKYILPDTAIHEVGEVNHRMIKGLAAVSVVGFGYFTLSFCS